MTILTTTDLSNTALDCLFISKVANVDYTSTTATNRDGDVIDTVIGRLARLGYEVPIAYAGSISFLATDYTKTIERSGIVYAPVTSALPFTTSVWGTDAAKFFVIQDTAVTTALVTDVADLVTLTGVAANSTNLGFFTSLLVPDSLDIKATLEGIGGNINDVINDNFVLIQTITTTAIPQQDITLDSGTYRSYRIEIIRAQPASLSTGRLNATIDNIITASHYQGVIGTESSAPATTSTSRVLVNFLATMQSTDRVTSIIDITGISANQPTMFDVNTTYTTAGQTANKMTNSKIMMNDILAATQLNLYWENGVNFAAGTSIRVYGRRV
jgi:hypothetical protein